MEQLSQESFEWISAHAADDPSRLRLKYGKTHSFEILQIECRHKYAAKLASTLAEIPEFVFPTALSAEQSTSDRLAAYHASLVPAGASVADLTAGLGVDASAMARRASVVAVERQEDLVDAMRHNYASIKSLKPVHADCRDFVAQAVADNKHFDVIFIDPARRGSDGQRLFALADCEPSVLDMMPSLKKICSRLVIKASPMLDIAHTMAEVPEATEIISLGTPTECKELDIICDFAHTVDSPKISAVTIGADFESVFTFTRAEEASAEVNYGTPRVGDFIFDPYPAVMKAGAFRLMSAKFDTLKLDANTQLWFSSELRPDFPGRSFEVIEILPYASKHIKRYAARYPRVGVTARNFDMTADALRAKLGVREGSDRLFAASKASGRYLITTRPL